MTRTEAYQTAKHKSRYGRRSWLAYQAVDGSWVATPEHSDTLRDAIDAQRDNGQRFYAMSGGVAFVQSPALAALRLKNAA